MEAGIEKAVRMAGSQSALANLIGVSPQAVQKWVAQGKPSPEGCKQIEVALHGQITRADLDVDLFGEIPVGLSPPKVGDAESERNGGMRIPIHTEHVK